MRVSASLQIISRPVGQLGLGLESEPHVVSRLGSGLQVGARGYLRAVFSVRGLSPGELFPRRLSPSIQPAACLLSQYVTDTYMNYCSCPTHCSAVFNDVHHYREKNSYENRISIIRLTSAHRSGSSLGPVGIAPQAPKF